jgi:hypothetical protein
LPLVPLVLLLVPPPDEHAARPAAINAIAAVRYLVRSLIARHRPLRRKRFKPQTRVWWSYNPGQ